MIDFTVEDVKAAYKATGLKPTKGRFYNSEFTCACPLTAIYTKRVGLKATRQQIAAAFARCDYITQEIRSTLGMTAEEFTSFWTGVDHNDLAFGCHDPHYNETAYKLGQAVREAIFDTTEVQ